MSSDRKLADLVMDNQGTVSEFVYNVMNDSKKSNKILTSYQKKGYDAIVDPYDYMAAMDYPVVLLNPKSSTSKVSSNKLR